MFIAVICLSSFDALVLRLFIGVAYVNATGYPIVNHGIIDIGIRVIKQCNLYVEEYMQWIARAIATPRIAETLDTFKTFWADKIMLVNQTAIPASLHGYGMAAVNNDDTVALYGKSIANFGVAYAATQESVKTQGTTIASMQTQVQTMHQYCMGLQQQPPPPPSTRHSSKHVVVKDHHIILSRPAAGAAADIKCRRTTR